MLTIGPYKLENRLILAPMAGITDLPFRKLCRHMGADLTIAEMITSDQRLWHTRKSRQRLRSEDERGPRTIQIAGSDPLMMAEAARSGEALGAHIIDINMGCPAKKVCNKAAGSALLRNERLVAEILQAVTNAVNLPVTLKIRTGWCKNTRNALQIAHIAEQTGVSALTVHGRTRACRFDGEAEYETIAEVKQKVSLPVIANGDINSAIKARFVLDYTGANALMIGRAAKGHPWIFAEIDHYIKTGSKKKPLSIKAFKELVSSHLNELHLFYGEFLGVRIARKHLGWYFSHLESGVQYRSEFNKLGTVQEQTDYLNRLFQKFNNDERLAA